MEETLRASLGQCYNVFFLDNNFLDATCLKLLLAKVLGIAIIAGAFGVKFPQILKIVRARSVEGLAVMSTVLELVGYLFTLSYNYRNGFPFTSYGEFMFITAQSLTILMLFYVYGRQSALQKQAILAYVVAYVTAGYVLLTNAYDLAPLSFVSLLQASTIPVYIASRVPQIWSNFKAKSAGQLALLTWVLNLAGGVARVFTTIQESNDPLMLVTVLLGVTLNGTIVAQILYYGSKSAKPKYQ